MLREAARVPEVGDWHDSPWNEARWADQNSSERLEGILKIVSSGSFPTTRSALTHGQLHQFRDAKILEAHSVAKRAVFVSNDARAFVKNDRRQQLEALLGTRILTRSEFEQELLAQSGGGV